jgi:hypothetical protein
VPLHFGRESIIGKEEIMQLLGLVIGLVGLALAVGPVGAAPPQATTITTDISFDFPSQGTFTATGPICSSGTFVDEFIAGGGSPDPTGSYAVIVRKHLTCDDDSGTFTIQFHPQSNPGNPSTFVESGPWAVVGNSGTGAYATLSGHGVFGLVVNGTIPETGTETFTGFMQLD